MDTESPRINEQALHELIDQADPKLIGAMGIEALTVLAKEMPTEKFHTFISGAVKRAQQLLQTAQQQAPEGNQG